MDLLLELLDTGRLPNRRTRAAKDLALACFPDLPKTEAYIRYAYLVRDLKKSRKIKEPPAKLLPQDPFRQARYDVEIYQKLLQSPPQEPVLKPQAMPVDVSPLSELQDFFQVLATSAAPEKQLSDKNGDYSRFFRGAYYVDGRIDLCKQVVGPAGIPHLMAAITPNPHIRHFLLGNNIVGETGGQCIGEWLMVPENQNRIETWYLAGNSLSVSGIAAIAKGLAEDRCCKSLWLKRNPLGPQGVKHVAHMLEQNSTLEILDLDNVACFDEGLAYLCQSLAKNETLQTLYLDANAITKTGMKSLANYFRQKETRPGLRNLFLGMNPIGSEGAEILAAGLSKYGYLERLSLNAGRIQPKGMETLLKNGLSGLLYLDLGFYKSAPDMGELPNYLAGGGPLLARFLQNHSTLRGLDLSNAFLEEDDFEAILEIMPAQKTLCYFVALRFKAKPLVVIRDIQQYCTRNRLLAKWPASDRFFKHSPAIRSIDSIYRNRQSSKLAS